MASEEVEQLLLFARGDKDGGGEAPLLELRGQDVGEAIGGQTNECNGGVLVDAEEPCRGGLSVWVDELVVELAAGAALELVQQVFSRLPEGLAVKVAGWEEGHGLDRLLQVSQQLEGLIGEAELFGGGDIEPCGVPEGQHICGEDERADGDHHDGGVGAVPSPLSGDGVEHGLQGGQQGDQQQNQTGDHGGIGRCVKLFG